MELRPVCFVCTGFSSFHGVASNPTTYVVNNLQEYLAERGRPIAGKAQIHSCTVLPVAAKEVRAWLAESATTLAKVHVDSEVIWIHFGVDVTEKKFIKLEACAVNNATFRCPDQDGWQPVNEMIDDSPGCSLRTVLQTDVPVDQLEELLRERKHMVKVSADAGLYVCNYTYFLSLELSQQSAKHKWHSLFVHVPSFDAICKEDQLKFAADLLDALATTSQFPSMHKELNGFATS